MTQTSNIRARLFSLLALLVLPVAVFFILPSALIADSSGVPEARTLSEGFVGVSMSQLKGYQWIKERVSAFDLIQVTSKVCCETTTYKDKSCSTTNIIKSKKYEWKSSCPPGCSSDNKKRRRIVGNPTEGACKASNN